MTTPSSSISTTISELPQVAPNITTITPDTFTPDPDAIKDPTAPLDPDNEALKALGQPYKRQDGTWSDGGTDSNAGNGTFRVGWTGNATIQKRRWALQLSLSHSISPMDIIEIMHSLIKKAKAGDRHCAETVLKYSVGDPVTMELMQRMKALEQAAGINGATPTDAKQDAEALEIVRTLKIAESTVA